MCLLDSVETWDDTTISCRTSTHRDQRNPLRARGRLTVSAGLEYAAQAMGAHVGLVDGSRRSENQIGYVGGVRDVTFSVTRLDDLAGDLTVDATRMVEGESSYMYRFTVSHSGLAIIEGRASIFVKAPSS
jgi:predicted hotdog family 3-hydroxylacyl-ACP dehydratase